MKKVLIGLVVLGIVGAIVFFVSSWNLKRTSINAYDKYVAQGPYDAIIVPGLPYDTERTDILLKVRMLWAKNLFDKGVTRNIIFSGGAVHSPWVEGKIMKTIADSLGIPSEHTFYEGKAEHGNENVYYSWKLAQRLGFKKVALATEQYQNFFLRRFIENKLPQLALLPVTVDSFPVYGKQTLPKINIDSAFAAKFVPLNQRESRLERMRSSFSDEVKER